MKYEYNLFAQGTMTAAQILSKLNQLGEEGWEYAMQAQIVMKSGPNVGVTGNTPVPYFYVKRPKTV